MKTRKSGKKIVIIRNAYAYDFGGGEKMPVHLGVELSKHGYEVVIVSGSAKLLAYASDKGVKTVKGWWWSHQNWSGYRIIFTPIYLIWQLLLTLWYLNLFSRLKPDIIHAQSRDDFIGATIAAKLLGKKVFWSDHADLKYVYLNSRKWYKNPVGKLVRWCGRGVRGIILTSQGDKRQVEVSYGRPLPAQYKIIYNGIFDQPKLAGQKHDGNNIVFAASSRLVTDKGIGELIEAFKALGDTPAQLWLFGDGPEESKFRRQAADNPNIIFKGFVSDITEQVAKADVFVHPSYMEGFSISLLEAAMLGKPIIACGVGGNPELIQDGVNGILIPARDSKALAAAMKTLATDKNLRQKLGDNARQKFEANFNFSNTVKEKYIPLYELGRPITILFDANPMVASGKSGIGYYTYYLAQALAETYPDQLNLVGHYYNFLGRRPISELPVSPNLRYRQSRLWPGKATNLLRRFNIEIPFEFLIKRRGDIIVFPNFLSLPSLFKTPIATDIHDLGFIDYPDFVADRNLSDLRRFVPKSIDRSSLIITISEFTKSRIKDSFNTGVKDVVVTPIPPLTVGELPQKEADRIIKELKIAKKYLLFIGNLEPRKNLLSLVNAYASLDEKIRHSISLVIAGGKGWKIQGLLDRVAQLQAQGFGIITPGYVSDEQRVALYQNATAMIWPSFYEGFGMPVLEAFSYGVATALSDIPVLREVAEDASLYFDPNKVDDIAECLKKIITDDKLRQKLIAGQAAILAKYSWSDNAKLLSNEFNKLLK